MSLSDGSEQFDIEIEIEGLDYSFLQSGPDDPSTANMSANHDDVEGHNDTPAVDEVHNATPALEANVPSPGAAVGPSLRPPEIFTPVHDHRPEVAWRLSPV